MAYHVTTALGRDVPLDDWVSLHGDRILRVLYDFASSPMNDGTHGLRMTVFANTTGLNLRDVVRLVRQLTASGLIRKTSKGCRITRRGIDRAGRRNYQASERALTI